MSGGNPRVFSAPLRGLLASGGRKKPSGGTITLSGKVGGGWQCLAGSNWCIEPSW